MTPKESPFDGIDRVVAEEGRPEPGVLTSEILLAAIERLQNPPAHVVRAELNHRNFTLSLISWLEGKR